MALTNEQRKEVDKHFSANLQSVSTDTGTKYYIQLHTPDVLVKEDDGEIYNYGGLQRHEIDKDIYEALKNSKENIATADENGNISLKSKTAAQIAVNFYPGIFSDFEYLYAKSKPTPETQYSGEEAQSSVAFAR